MTASTSRQRRGHGNGYFRRFPLRGPTSCSLSSTPAGPCTSRATRRTQPGHGSLSKLGTCSWTWVNGPCTSRSSGRLPAADQRVRHVERPVRGDAHAGFGGRPRETDREQPRHRAPGRLNQVDVADAHRRSTGCLCAEVEQKLWEVRLFVHRQVSVGHGRCKFGVPECLDPGAGQRYSAGY